MIRHILAYSSILISSATDLPLLTITSTLHARLTLLAFILFKVGLPSPSENCLKQLGVDSRHVLQAGTLTGYDCHVSGNKKAHHLVSFLINLVLYIHFDHYSRNIPLRLIKVKPNLNLKTLLYLRQLC